MGAIPSQVLEALARRRSSARRVALVLRHAERHPVFDVATHERVLLTEAGLAMARAAGAELFSTGHLPDALSVRHSPVERCAQTARNLVEGYRALGGSARLVGPDPLLATPFVKDRERAYALVNGLGHAFIRAWFDGEVPEDCFARRHHAAEEQLSAVVSAMGACEGACVLVTHDWNIALVREEFLGVRHEEFGWPGFLDGLVVVDDGERIHLAIGDREVSLPRRIRP